MEKSMDFVLQMSMVMLFFFRDTAYAVMPTGKTRYYNFTVESSSYTRLCNTHDILTVNGKFPGPSVYANRDDKLIITVYNKAKQNITIHWHGVKQRANPWSDGASYITQSPIQPGNCYTYSIDLSSEEGTMWWHAHHHSTRATVHGSIIVHPPFGHSYPFVTPFDEVHIILGEWWIKDVLQVYYEAMVKGEHPSHSDAYTINGLPGYLYPCSKKDTFRLMVRQGKTYLLRIINAAMDEQLFFAIAKHQMTLVAMDGSYTEPLLTDYIMISPGQTMDVLVEANQTPDQYVMASSAFDNGMGSMKDDHMGSMNIEETMTKGNMPPMSPDHSPMPMPAQTITTAFFHYVESPAHTSSDHSLPSLPAYHDTHAADNFTSHLAGLKHYALKDVDEHMFLVLSNNAEDIMTNMNCDNKNMSMCMQMRHLGSINNISFVEPNVDILHAYYHRIGGIYAEDFPREPQKKFNYTGKTSSMMQTVPKFGTKVKVLAYNTVVEMVFQGTSLVNAESHPMHLHGHSFYVVGWGFGNFDPHKDPLHYNLVNPPKMSTVPVPKNGWAAIRFKADNPGVWLLHCHFEHHHSVGMSTVLIVKNGKTNNQRILVPPSENICIS